MRRICCRSRSSTRIPITAAGTIKVDAHHAIIPTARASNVNLTENEAKVYNLIARQYLMQFCPDAVFRKCVIELEIAKGKFIAKARFLAEAGWRTLLGNKERDEERRYSAAGGG